MNGIKNKTAQMPGMEEMDDAIVRVPGRAAELVRLAMMHDPVARGMSMKSMLGSLCIQYADGVIAKRGVSVPEHLASRSKGGAR